MSRKLLYDIEDYFHQTGDLDVLEKMVLTMANNSRAAGEVLTEADQKIEMEAFLNQRSVVEPDSKPTEQQELEAFVRTRG